MGSKIRLIEKDAFKGLGPSDSLIQTRTGISGLKHGGESPINFGLSLQSNSLTTIQKDTLTELKSVRTLELTFNKISSIEQGSFSRLQSLVKLVINNNHLSVIQVGTLTGLYSLKYLHLHHNELQTLEEAAFHPLYSTTTISLYCNKLTSLSQTHFLNLPRPLKLQLSCTEPHERWWTTSRECCLGYSTNQWNCSSLCWLKQEEWHGTWTWDMAFDSPSSFNCAKLVNDWKCGDSGEAFSASFIFQILGQWTLHIRDVFCCGQNERLYIQTPLECITDQNLCKRCGQGFWCSTSIVVQWSICCVFGSKYWLTEAHTVITLNLPKRQDEVALTSRFENKRHQERHFRN